MLAGMRVLALSGSLRAQASSTALLHAAAALAPAGMELEVYAEELGALPIFNPDLDGEGAVPPPAVGDLRRRLAAADGLLVCTPEYAHGVPGALKNALDWIVSSGELTDKPTVLLAASPSGAEWARAGLTPTLEVMGARLLASRALVLARKHLDARGQIADATVAEVVRASLAALATAVAAGGSPPEREAAK
jgi:NAD(P)H-dependent FMN reductase